MGNVKRYGNAILVLDKIAAVLYDENYAGQDNTLLVFVEGVREGIPVKVSDARKTFDDINRELKKARGTRD
jgi:hypothetical protein